METARATLLLAVASCCLDSGIAAAGAVESSYRTARKVIDGSISYMQAGQRTGPPAPLLIEARGTYFHGAEHQGHAPGRPTPATLWETWAFEADSGRVGREYRSQHPDGTSRWIREVYLGGNEKLLIRLDEGFAVRYTGSGIDAGRDRNLRRFPPMLLRESLQNAASLRSLGRYGPFDGVQVQTRGRQSLSLFFARESHTLSWVEYLADLPTFSDSTVRWKFSDYRLTDGAGKLPYRYGIHVNGEVLADMAVQRVSTDRDEIRRFLDLPRGMGEPETREIADGPGPADGARVERVGDGVYRIADLRDGFHTLFVEFDTFVLMVDAPSGFPLLGELPAGGVAPGISESAVSRHAIGLISKTTGAKPIRYLVLTHFHNDHAGGLPAFGGQGIELIAEASEVGAIQAFLDAAHTLCQAEPAAAGSFRLQALHKRRVISDGVQRVEIIDVGDNPHSAHMLVVWIPGQSILYAADVLTGRGGRPDRRHAKLNRHFLDWMERRRIRPELILTAHGDGFVYPPGDLRVDAQHTLNTPRDP